MSPPTPPSDSHRLTALLRNKASSRALSLLVLSLRRRLLRSSLEIALATALLLKQIVSNARFSSLADLLLLLRLVGRELEAANRGERVQGNVVRKVMKLVREEWKAFVVGQSTSASHEAVRPPSTFSLSNFLATSTTNPSASSSSKASSIVPLGLLSDPFGPSTAPSPLLTNTGTFPNLEPAEYTWDSTSAAGGEKVASLKPLLIQAIQEVVDELETVVENVAKGGAAHVHSSCVPLTLLLLTV